MVVSLPECSDNLISSYSGIWRYQTCVLSMWSICITMAIWWSCDHLWAMQDIYQYTYLFFLPDGQCEFSMCWYLVGGVYLEIRRIVQNLSEGCVWAYINTRSGGWLRPMASPPATPPPGGFIKKKPRHMSSDCVMSIGSKGWRQNRWKFTLFTHRDLWKDKLGWMATA